MSNAIAIRNYLRRGSTTELGSVVDPILHVDVGWYTVIDVWRIIHSQYASVMYTWCLHDGGVSSMAVAATFWYGEVPMMSRPIRIPETVYIITLFVIMFQRKTSHSISYIYVSIKIGDVYHHQSYFIWKVMLLMRLYFSRRIATSIAFVANVTIHNYL